MIDRTKKNVVGNMRHAVACPSIQTDGHAACDCSPIDESKAMSRDDVLRIFAPLPEDEAEALRDYL